jgi:heat-inducible transcriptional repressor
MQRDRQSNTILQLVVEAYIQNAQPVSSSAVASRCPDLGLSSATIRAEMADLEAQGLLEQPHTSSGRVPTQRGLRVYLDSSVNQKLRPWDRARLEAAASHTDARAFPAHPGQTISGLSGHMAVVAVPRVAGTHLKEIGLVRCDVGRILAYFVSPHGSVEQKLLLLDFDITVEKRTAVSLWGPTRMDYARLIPLVQYATRLVGRV